MAEGGQAYCGRGFGGDWGVTTIVMVQTADDVIAGWDSLVAMNGRKGNLVQDKVWAQGGVVYGFAGSMGLADIIQSLEFPVYDGTDPRLWIIKKWAPVLREATNENNFAFNGEDGLFNDFSLLMVVAGQVFDLDAVLSPSQTQDGLYVAGSGAKTALGALHAGGTVMQALEAAAATDPYTGGDLTAKSVRSILDEQESVSDGQYRIRVERANQPHKAWGFVVDYTKMTEPDEFAFGIGAIIKSTLDVDNEFLRGKHGGARHKVDNPAVE